MPEEIVLTAADVRSATWTRLSQVLERRLQALRELNDAPATPEKTSETRGRIAEIKRTLDLAKDASSREDGPPIEQVVSLTAG